MWSVLILVGLRSSLDEIHVARGEDRSVRASLNFSTVDLLCMVPSTSGNVRCLALFFVQAHFDVYKSRINSFTVIVGKCHGSFGVHGG
jgi:hypothetical protein